MFFRVKIASLPSERLLLEMSMENKSDVVLCVVGLFYKHKDKAFCNQTEKCLPWSSSLLRGRGGQPVEGLRAILPRGQAVGGRKNTEKGAGWHFWGSLSHEHQPAFFLKILWPQMLVSALVHWWKVGRREFCQFLWVLKKCSDWSFFKIMTQTNKESG